MENPTKETIYRILLGLADPQEEKQMSDWYSRDPEACSKAVGEVHALIDFTELARLEQPVKNARVRKFFRKAAIWTAAAAVAVLFVVSSAYFSHVMTVNSFSEQTVSVEAPFGERLKIILPDSSSVYLNSGSSLEYPVVFRKDSRDVKLSGEAMFEVTHDKSRPFTVKTFATEISVLGTKFNVKADSRRNSFSAALLEGRIKVVSHFDSHRNEIILSPNDVLSIENGVMSMGRLKGPDDLCWTAGLIKIDGKDFDELMSDFEKAFDVRIIIRRDRLPDISGVSGKIRVNDGVVNALRILQHTTDFKFRKNDETNIITIY